MSLPILYAQDATDFFSLGLGPMQNVLEAYVYEERNGVFYLELKMLTDKTVKEDQIIRAHAGHLLKDQRFVIKKITDNHNGTSGIYAEHVSYLTQGLTLKPETRISNLNGRSALVTWKSAILEDNPFSVYSDITTTASTTWRIDKVNNPRRALGGVEGSILDIWGGEYRFDNYQISLLKKRGTTAQTVLAYGRNITGFEMVTDIESVYTSIYPFAIYENEGVEELIAIDGLVVDVENIENYPNRRTLPVNFSDKFEHDEKPKKERLIALAEQYITANNVGVPKVSIRVNFLDLSQTADYADYKGLETVNLCDDVRVIYPSLGVDTVAKVTRVKWNVLTDSYDEIEIGEKRLTLGSQLNDKIENLEKDINNQINWSQISADGKNTIFYGLYGENGLGEPTANKVGDMWFKPNGEDTEFYIWDGTIWKAILTTGIFAELALEIQQAQQAADEAKVVGEQAELAGQAALALGQEALAAGQAAQQQAHQAELTGQAAQQKADQAEITGQQAELAGRAAQQKAGQADADAKQALSELEDVRDDIGFTVKKDELIGQINLQAGKTIFRQNDNVVMITPETTYISDGTIKTAHIALANITSALIKDLAVTDAKIASLTASKLTAGTIDANIITVTNLNASLITTGQMDVARLKVADLRVGTANILDLNVTEGKIADLAVSSAKIKDAAITTAKIGDAQIVTAKIGDLAVTGAKIADATISSAKIISLDANKITAQTLSAITANTGDLNVSGNLTMLTPNNLITGVFDYGDPVGGAHNPRYFKNGYMAIGQQNIAYTADIHELTSSGTAGAFKYYGDSYFGPDTLKLRNYTYKGGPVQGTTSIYAGQMVLANDFEGTNNGITLNGITGRVWSRGAVTCSTIEPNIFTGSFQINSGYTNNIAKLHLAAGATGASFNWDNKQGYADFFAGKDNTAVIWSNSVYPRTYSQSANMVINTDGSFGRATSASKYKLNISEIENVDELAYNLLTIRPKRWNDKKETEEIANELSIGEKEVRDTLYLRQYHGLIAEDLRAAGLDAYISYDNKTGEIEGIEYDKLWTLLIPIVKKQQEDILDLKLTLGVA